MTSRRRLIFGMAGLGAAAAGVRPAAAAPQFEVADMRGSLDASQHGVWPGAADDQSKALSRLIEAAAGENRPVFLPPGTYRVANLTLPDNARLSGVPGATRLVYSGAGHLILAENATRIALSGLSIDGAHGWLADYARALVECRNVAEVSIEDCDIAGSRKSALVLEGAGGRIAGNRLSGARQFAVYALESRSLSITGNRVHDCGNGGILVHRWSQGEDGTLVSANRIERIAATAGGTGQNGNGINVYRAANVTISDNHVADCAFSAIRANAGSGVIVSGNRCLRSGETALYSEFSFEGAVVSGNLVDGAANGISIANFDEGGRLATVAGNIVRNVTGKGPYPPEGPGFGWGIAAEAETAITGNVVEDVAKWGMLIGWGPYLRGVAVTGNTIRGAATGLAVSVVEGAGETLIADNIFRNVPGGAVIGHRWAEAVTADLAAPAAAAVAGRPRHAHLTVNGNVVA